MSAVLLNPTELIRIAGSLAKDRLTSAKSKLRDLLLLHLLIPDKSPSQTCL